MGLFQCVQQLFLIGGCWKHFLEALERFLEVTGD